MRIRSVFPLLSLPVLLAAPPRQAPYAAWRTIRTAHYRIHYPPVLADWAQDVASRVEGIHGAVVKAVGYESPKPVQVVLVDPLEEANGMAVPLLPCPFVMLWRTHPESDQLHAGAMSGWTEGLVTHELTHIHHMTRPQNQPNFLDRIAELPFSPMVWKSPRWVIEGYATLLEGWLTGSGRPHSATRAAILRQWALQGKLPEYGALNNSPALYGSNMAYLAGSAYLEWLERQRPQTLQRLWKQIVSRRRRDFDAAFKATFGFLPRDGYERFRAELDHDALEWEQRLKAEGLREGELWMRVEHTVSDLSVSPDGERLLAFAGDRNSPGLRVWNLKEEPKKTAEGPSAEDAKDPNEVEDVAPEFPNHKLVNSLPLLNFHAPNRPEWIDDRTVKFMLKRTDNEGVQKREPALWHLQGGLDTHPTSIPPGRWTILKPVHRDGRWILECRGRVVPLPGQAAGRAILDESTKMLYAACGWEGTWNLVRVPATESGFGEPQRLTRTLSAVWNPAPTPDGKTLYFTRLDARGIEIRKLDLTQAPIESAPSAANADAGPIPEARILNPSTILHPPTEPGTIPPPGSVPTSEPYRALDNLWNAPAACWTITPAGKSFQIGFSGRDLLDRLAWQFLVSEGAEGGPSGAVAGFSYGGWAWRPSATVFLAREKPSMQQYFHPQGLDLERKGGEFSFSYENLSDQPFRISPVIAWERDNALAEPLRADRGQAGLRAKAAIRWGRGPLGWFLQGEGEAYQGRTRFEDRTESWMLRRGRLSLGFGKPTEQLVLKVEGGRVSAGMFGGFHLGGLTSVLVPLSLDADRIEQAALPAYSTTGEKFLRWRGELGGSVRLYVDGTALWSLGDKRGAFQRVAGIELSLSEAIGMQSRKMELNFGAHRILDGPLKKHDVVTTSFIWRP